MTYYISYQNYLDNNKVKNIAASMEKNGWIGAPIVIWGDVLMTGNHRYAACKALEISPEIITLEDVFEEDGLDFCEVHADCGFPTADESLNELFLALSDEIVEKYGIQW